MPITYSHYSATHWKIWTITSSGLHLCCKTNCSVIHLTAWSVFGVGFFCVCLCKKMQPSFTSQSRTTSQRWLCVRSRMISFVAGWWVGCQSYGSPQVQNVCRGKCRDSSADEPEALEPRGPFSSDEPLRNWYGLQGFTWVHPWWHIPKRPWGTYTLTSHPPLSASLALSLCVDVAPFRNWVSSALHKARISMCLFLTSLQMLGSLFPITSSW